MPCPDLDKLDTLAFPGGIAHWCVLDQGHADFHLCRCGRGIERGDERDGHRADATHAGGESR